MAWVKENVIDQSEGEKEEDKIFLDFFFFKFYSI